MWDDHPTDNLSYPKEIHYLNLLPEDFRLEYTIMAYWLFKSEPDEYSIDDLAAEPSGSGRWDGIRNYQARNNLRDHVKKGDHVFFYHSSCKVPGISGIAKVVKAAYVDPAQFDPENHYYDPKSTPDNPRWYCVDVSFVDKFAEVIDLTSLKTFPELTDMVLVKQGRLSIQPVTDAEWEFILSQNNAPPCGRE